MRTAFHTLACAGAVLVGAAPPGTAQIGVGVGVIYLSPAGVDFTGTDAGPGLDGQLRFSAGSHLSFGLGAQWSRHDAPSLNSHFTVLAIFAEPRFAIPVPPSAVQPYVAARVGYAHERIVAGGTTYHARPVLRRRRRPPVPDEALCAHRSVPAFRTGALRGFQLGRWDVDRFTAGRQRVADPRRRRGGSRDTILIAAVSTART